MNRNERIRVLLADDHPHGREGMREIIGIDPAFEIVGEAVNGEQAVLLAAEKGPDLVLMDINMPVMNGMEATQNIKAIDPRIKVVMVTVSGEITDLFEAIKRGAQGYLLKNLSPSSWIEYLRAVAIDEAPLPRELAFRLLQEFGGGAGTGSTDEAGAGPGATTGTEPGATTGTGPGATTGTEPGAWPGPESGAERGGPGSRPSISADWGLRGEPNRPQQGCARNDGKSPLTQREREVLERVASGESNRQIAEGFGLSEHTVKNHLKNILQKLHLDNRVQLTRYAIEKGLLNR